MEFLTKLVFKIFRPVAYIIGYFLPLEENKIVVSSYGGKGYGDNPKYIVNKIIERNPNVRVVWLLKNIKDSYGLPSSVEFCGIKSITGIYHLMTAKVWIDNVRKRFRIKKKQQFYLNTWHGFALKRIEKDAEHSLDKGYVSVAIRDSKHIDLMVSCSRFMTNIYKNAFWYAGKVIEIGAPRNDIILRNDKKICNKVRGAFKIADEQGIVVYAPTFRANKSLDAYNLDYGRLKRVLELKFGKKFVILARLHPNISDRKLGIDFDGKNICDATQYQDMQELLCAADVVVTDYSSVMFDFALSKKPCFLFATDVDDYIKDRNFYFAIEELPFSLAENNDELMKNILEFNKNKYIYGVSKFFDKVGMITDGKASEKCAALILEKM